jgi:hypothetical protein
MATQRFQWALCLGSVVGLVLGCGGKQHEAAPAPLPAQDSVAPKEAPPAEPEAPPVPPLPPKEKDESIEGMKLVSYSVRLPDAVLPCATVEYRMRQDVHSHTLKIAAHPGTRCDLFASKDKLEKGLEQLGRHLGNLRIATIELEGAGLFPKPTAKKRAKVCELAKSLGVTDFVGSLVDTHICEYGSLSSPRPGAHLERVVYEVEHGKAGVKADAGLAFKEHGELTLSSYSVAVESTDECNNFKYSFRRFAYREHQKLEPDGHLDIRSRCTLRKRDASSFHKSLERIQSLAGATFHIDRIFVSDPGLHFYETLARAAIKSRKWDQRRGKARKGKGTRHTYDLVCAIANEYKATKEIQALVAPFAQDVRCDSIEKLFVVPVSKLPFADTLIGEGISAKARVPYSAMYSFSAVPKK